MIYYRVLEKRDGKFVAQYRRRFWPFWDHCFYDTDGHYASPREYDSRDDAVNAAVKHGDRQILENRPKIREVWSTRRFYDETLTRRLE
jgi:hypothetical protein